MGNQWENKLRAKMADYSEEEPEGLWDSIMDQLPDQARPAGPGSGRKTVRIIVLTAVAAASAAVILLSGGPEIGTAPIYPYAIADAGHTVMASIPEASAIPEFSRPGRAVHILQNTAPAEEIQDSPAEDAASPDSGTESMDIRPGKEHRKSPDEREMPYSHEDGTFPQGMDFGEDSHRAGRKPGRFSAGLSISNLTGSRQQYSGYGTIQPHAASFKGIPTENAISGIPGTGLMLLSEGNQSSTKIRHRQPVRAGVSFRYSLNDRWGVETGLSYTYLSSRMDSGNSDLYSSTTDQTLHYIGIPLKASYRIFSTKFLTVYASAGGMAEKCVAGKAVTRYAMQGNETDRNTDRIQIRPLQWSVSAEAGIQGNITEMLGIYIEPGIIWYFDNGSMVSTVYTEKPFNFNLEFGLRFSFE